MHIYTQFHIVALMACKNINSINSIADIWRKVQYAGAHAAAGSDGCFRYFTFNVVQQSVSQTGHDCQASALWTSAGITWSKTRQLSTAGHTRAVRRQPYHDRDNTCSANPADLLTIESFRGWA